MEIKTPNTITVVTRHSSSRITRYTVFVIEIIQHRYVVTTWLQYNRNFQDPIKPAFFQCGGLKCFTNIVRGGRVENLKFLNEQETRSRRIQIVFFAEIIPEQMHLRELTRSCCSGFCWLRTGRPDVWTDAAPRSSRSAGRPRNCRPTRISPSSAATANENTEIVLELLTHNRSHSVIPLTVVSTLSVVPAKLLDFYGFRLGLLLL